MDQVAAFSRFYREQMLRAETGLLPPNPSHRLDS
jgi:hypothetical protein